MQLFTRFCIGILVTAFVLLAFGLFVGFAWVIALVYSMCSGVELNHSFHTHVVYFLTALITFSWIFWGGYRLKK